MLLYAGNYQKFFSSIGRIPGTIFVIAILCLIGPFGGIPRAIAVSHSTLVPLLSKKLAFPNLPIFSLICCVLIYVFTCRLSQIIQWLGKVFFPIMLITLVWIIFKGLTLPANPSPSIAPGAATSWFAGMSEGFNTMDLLAAFFFCSIVLISIRQMLAHANDNDDELPLSFDRITKKDKRTLILAFILAGCLLELVYLGFALTASRHAGTLLCVSKGQILGKISSTALGSSNLLSGICVFIACLTTEIAVVGIVADFLARVISSKQMTYSRAVIITLIPTYLVSILNFENISLFLLPLLQLSYPALIALTCGNIAHKLLHFRHVKALFYLTLFLTIAFQLIG